MDTMLQAGLSNAPSSALADAGKFGVWLDQFVAAWEADHTLTAVAFARHARIAGDAHLVAVLGYEELLRRHAAGEDIDLEAFERQFPDGGKLVREILGIHEVLHGEVGMLQGLPALPNSFGERLRASAHTEWPKRGETLAGFYLLGELGRGAFARVYLAEELALGRRRVVVKVSKGGAKEARTLGKLRHPNIVPVFSVQFEPSRELSLICMPFLGRVTLRHALPELFRESRRPRSARDLADVLARLTPPLVAARHDSTSGETTRRNPNAPAPIDSHLLKGSYVDAVVRLAEQLAGALAYANRQGIYHRDLKPSNVLLDPSGKPMLLDFNVSFDRQAATAEWGGCLPYMAPEIVRVVAESGSQVAVHPRSDVYSLAVMLYELLSGQHPFDFPPDCQVTEATALELYARQQVPLPGLSRRNPDVGPALSALVARCLSFDPNDRPQTADELFDALHRLAGRGGRMRRWVWRHRGGVRAVSALLLMAVATGGYVLASLPSYAERQFLAAQSARQQGDYAGALACLEAAEAKGVLAEPIARLRGDTHWQLAKLAFVGGDFVAAREECSAAIQAGQPTCDAYLLRARAAMRLGEYSGVLEDTDLAESLDAVPRIHAVRADFFCATGKWDSAVTAYRRALSEGVESAGLHSNLAYALANLGHRRQALASLNEAISADGELGDAYYQRAKIVAALARDKDTTWPRRQVSDIESAMKLLPNNYRVYLAAADIFARLDERDGDGENHRQAAAYLLQSLRLGLSPSELPPSGPLAAIIPSLRDSQEYQAALKTGASAQRQRLPGLVDALGRLPLD